MENRPTEFPNTIISSALAFAFNAFFAQVLQWLKAFLVMILWLIPLIFIMGFVRGIFASLGVQDVADQMIITIPGWITYVGIKQQYVTIPYISMSYYAVIALIIMVLITAYYLSAMHLGSRRILINYYDTGEIAFRPVFNLRMIVSNMVASSILLLLTLGGLILFIIPGIIIILRSFFTGYLIVDKNMGPIEAIQESWALTKDRTNITLGLVIIMLTVSTVIPIAGMVMAGLMMVYVYRAGLLK